MLSRLFRAMTPPDNVHNTYVAVVEQARNPEFYRDWSVPDTVEGRFELIVLHGFAVMRRLSKIGKSGQRQAQQLYEIMFADFDRNLREMGVGDVGIGRRMNEMSRAFFGRARVYDGALSTADREALLSALRRNVYRDAAVDAAACCRLADYVTALGARLAARDDAAILSGDLGFVAPDQMQAALPVAPDAATR